MFNNRMLAVAAVLVMAVPALGAATPIVVPPVPEQLVEGHTVFTVIEIVKGAANATNETRFAAAVAVLVREYTAEERASAQRFPGVLWFNDQYLVNPEQNTLNDNAAAFRYPCGGAVVAVNRGDPDPRMVIARVNAGTPTIEGDLPDGVDTAAGGDLYVPGGAGPGTSVGGSSYTYNEDWTKPYPGTYYYGQNNTDAGPDGQYGTADDTPNAATDYAWIGVTGGQGTVNATNPSATGQIVYSDTVVGTTLSGLDVANLTAPWDYRESYLITDPNDHTWVIDQYEFYTRDSNVNSQNANNLETKLGETGPAPIDTDGDGIPDYTPSEHYPMAFGGALETQYAYPVWVVNMLGSPAFVPDGGENCLAFKDLLEEVTAPANGALCGVAAPNPLGSGSNDEVTLNAYNGVPPWTDDPCMSYQEPSRNGYCYQGATPDPVNGCDPSVRPQRMYNALLYFKLEDLRVFGAPRDHTDPNAAGTDTNGCSQEQYPWGPNPPQAANDWPCPAANDDMEGNSHPFHPTTPTHNVAEACRPEFWGPNPANHGGSTYVTPGMRASDDGWYELTAPCDYLHATRNIDIYFNGGGRPFVPPVRNFVLVDLEGSSAPFQDYHCSYEGAACGSESAAPLVDPSGVVPAAP